MLGGNSVLDNFVLPDGAREDLMRAGGALQMRTVSDGVNVMSGHDNGVAFRFFEHAERNEAKSKAAKIAIFDKEDMIEWNKGKRNKPTEKVRFLPEGLLAISSETGEILGGRADMVEAYKRYKAGLAAQGTPLTRWNALDASQVATLASAGIFSVEQFAASPRHKIEGVFPRDLCEKFEEAIQYVNGQQGRFDMEKLATENVALSQALEKQADATRELLAKVEALEKKATKKAKKESADGNA